MINLLAIVVAAEEEAGDPPNPVIPVENEIVWAAIFFFALWAMMKFVLLPPILRAMEERSSTIQSGKDAADAATRAWPARRDHEATCGGSCRSQRHPRRGVPPPTSVAALQAEADTEIAEMRRSAQAEIDQARAEALSGMRGDVSSLAVGAAQIVLGRDLDAGNQQSVIDQALSAD